MLINNNVIGIVAHDAGAANHIISWLIKERISLTNCRVCFKGPALKQFNKAFPLSSNYETLENLLQDVDVILTGTGWATSLEYDAIYLAKNLGLTVYSLIDNWVNFRERFWFNEQEVLPDEIWVTDDYAFNIATKEFPNITIRKQVNDFLALQVEEIKTLSLKAITKEKVLFVMEPIRDSWADNIPGEVQALNLMLANLNVLGLPAKIDIVIKPHPSDYLGKYQQLLINHNLPSLSVNEESSLAELIASATVVVGCQTYAMVIALAAGKKVISALPEYAPACTLPHKNIIHLSRLLS